jgi:hypothetical protein
MRWTSAAVLLALGACTVAEEAPPQPEVRAPAATLPAQPTRPTPPRPARRPAEPAVQGAPAAGPAPIWRVTADGTTGCADPAVLRLLREEGEGTAQSLRRLAAARAAGGCVTVFRVLAWRLLEAGGPILRLSPADSGRPLYFWRDEVVEERPV